MTLLLDFALPESSPRLARHKAGDHSLCSPDSPGHGTCSQCGKTVQVSRSSAPAERRRCRDCQRSCPKDAPEPRICALCEESYVPKPMHRPDQRWCSKSCAQAWRNGARPPYVKGAAAQRTRDLASARVRRLRHAQTWDGITDEEILERDGWRCGICRKVIGKKFKYPHPRSKSIDHIIPLAHGGDDTAANKRAAHLGCNLARGDKMGDEQVALFGSIREPPLATVTAGERAVMFQRKQRVCACGAISLKGRKFCQRCLDRRAADTEEYRQAVAQALAERRSLAAETRRLRAERTAALHAEIRKLRAQGYATRAIAEYLGTSHRMVIRVGLADPVTGKLPR